jgi:predicted nucleic acid-binding protein
MKVDFIADTNLLIYIHEGNEIIAPFLNYQFAISFITEVELLGFEGISKNAREKIISSYR